MLKKLFYLLKGGNLYKLYWFDLLTERHLKNRVGECVDCIECCKYSCNCNRTTNVECYCIHTDLKTKRCNIYDNRKCNIWFPISQKEIDIRARYQHGFICKFSFKKQQ